MTEFRVAGVLSENMLKLCHCVRPVLTNLNIVVGKPASSSSDACRFCGTRNGTELSAVGSVCSDPDCQVPDISFTCTTD